MAIRRRRTTEPSMETEEIKESLDKVEIDSRVESTIEVATESEPTPPPAPPKVEKTNKIFLGEEEKRLMKKFTQHIVKKLKLSGTRSYKV